MSSFKPFQYLKLNASFSTILGASRSHTRLWSSPTWEKACVKHYDSTFSRADNGQFVVHLPLWSLPVTLNNNCELAFCNLYRTEKLRQIEIHEQYMKFLRQYEQLMNKVKLIDLKSYFISHQALLQPTSIITILRVVFNASYKTLSSNSLNDVLISIDDRTYHSTRVILNL